ncbi:uncharacterized protein LOC123525551 [Mercenaria mercenaria]|uniref:uncharacterized protein LOC123525551 n=1 Tax=Mercenaria mercenaria TaxID=6596 RepID=UPI00234E5B1A|nr:uncharacterized protein LOC123525551 [Mercenaria mercenaria]
MASTIATSSSEDCECAICSETLKKPKLLSCSHKFCELCISTWIAKSRTRSGVECPLCRKITSPPKTGSEPAFWAGMLPDFITETEKEIILCQPCKSTQETKEAKFYCLDCKEYLCVFCHVTHTKLKVSNLHKTVAVDVTEDGKMSTYLEYNKLLMCETHPDKEIEFFCEDDDAIFCPTCAFLHHRSCDNVLEIKSNFADIENVKPLPALSKDLQKLTMHVKEDVAILRRYDKKLENDEQTLTTVLKETKNIVLKGFEKVHEQIRRQMKEKNRHNKLANDERMNECEEIIAYLDKSDKTTRDTMGMAIDRPEYVIISRQLEERYTKINDQIQALLSRQKTFSCYNFEFDQDFLKSLSQIKTFGTFTEEKCDFLLPGMEKSIPLKDRHFELAKETVVGRQKPYFPSACYIVDDKDDRIVLADQNNKRLVIFLPRNGNEDKIKLGSKPYMVVSTQKSIYVSFPHEKKIRKYDTRAAFKQTSEIRTKHQCYAIDCLSKCDDAKIVASLYDGETWNLVTYGSGGHELSCMTEDCKGDAFKTLWHFKVFQGIVYHSCQEDNHVIAFELATAEHIFTYTNRKLKCPGGIDIDFEENVYICGISSANIHMITRQGQQIRIVELSELKIKMVPTTIALSDNSEDLVILGNANNPGPFLYQLK